MHATLNPYALASAQLGNTAGLALSPSFAQVLQGGAIGPGQFGPSVLLVQQYLAALCFASPLSGVYCALTLAAMQRFQAQHALPTTGAVDARGLRLLETLGGAAQAPMAPVQAMPARAAATPTPRAAALPAPGGGVKAGVLALQPRRRAAEEEVPTGDDAYRTKKAQLADLNLRQAQRELDATTQELSSRGFVSKMFLPEETKVRRETLAQVHLPELRARQAEYQAAQRLGAPPAELDAKLDRYFTASIEAREFVKGSLDTERGQFAETDKKLERTIHTTRVVRDVSLGTAAALSTGGGALVAGGVVAGGALVKTASDEADKRIATGQASSAGELASGLAKNGAGLAVDAAGGAALRTLGAAAHAGRIGAGGFAAGAGGTALVTGATKRGIAGEEVLDGRAMLTDVVTGAVTGGASQRLAPSLSRLGAGARATAEGAAGAAGGAGAQVVSNAVHGRELTEGVGEATLVGAGTGVVLGATGQRKSAAPEAPALPPTLAAPAPLPQRSLGTLDTARLSTRTREGLAALAAQGQKKVTVYSLGPARDADQASRLAQRSLDGRWRDLHAAGTDPAGVEPMVVLGDGADARVRSAFANNKGQRNDVVKTEIDLDTGRATLSQVDFDPRPVTAQPAQPAPRAAAPRPATPAAPARVPAPRPIVDAPRPSADAPTTRVGLTARDLSAAFDDRVPAPWNRAHRSLDALRAEGVQRLTVYAPNVGGLRAPQDLAQVALDRLGGLRTVPAADRAAHLAFEGAAPDADMAALLRGSKASPNRVVKAVFDLTGPVPTLEATLVDFAP